MNNYWKNQAIARKYSPGVAQKIKQEQKLIKLMEDIRESKVKENDKDKEG